MKKETKHILPENLTNLDFSVSDYALELFEIKFNKILKNKKSYICTQEENFKNEIKDQFFEFLLVENPWNDNNFKRNTENAVNYYFNTIASF